MSSEVLRTTSGRAGAALPFSTVALFGFGDWGPSTVNTAVLFFLPFFLTDIARLPPSHAALVLLVGGACDALAVPMAGALSDRTRTRWGRRRPFLLLGAAPLAVAFAMLWSIPSLQGYARVAYFALAYAALDAALACVQVPYAALTPEIGKSESDRTRLNAARAIVSMVGGLVAAAAIPAAVQTFSDRAAGYRGTMAVVGAVAAMPFVLLFANVREAKVSPIERTGLREEMRSVLRSARVRRVAAVYFAAWATVSVVAAMFEYYVAHVLGLHGKLEIILGVVQCSALVSVPLVAWACEKWSKERVLAVGSLWWAAVMACLGALPLSLTTAGYGLAVLVGPGVAAAHVVPWTMIADAVDRDAAECGRKREGAIYGVLGFAQKGGTALTLALVQWTLGASGYVAGATQSPTTKLVIRLLFGAAPAAALALLAVALLRTRTNEGASA